MGMKMVLFRETKLIGIHRVLVAMHLHQEKKHACGSDGVVGCETDLQKGFGTSPFIQEGQQDTKLADLAEFYAEIK